MLRRSNALFLICSKESASRSRQQWAGRARPGRRRRAIRLRPRVRRGFFVLQIIIQGRGGQGAQTAGNLLATAFFAEGRQVQSFASYGGARRGTPVNSFIRVDERPIRLRCDIERADAILCFDSSLLEGRLLAAAGAGTAIVVNSSRSPEEYGQRLPGCRIIPVDGVAISRRHGLGRIVNSALLGGFARAIGTPALPVLLRALVEEAPKLHDENVAACEEGYRAVDARMERAVA
jgi:pyruvate ferredoxin oxidoreductase gamma subunit